MPKNPTPAAAGDTNPTPSMATLQAVLRGVSANVLVEHRDAPDLASRLAVAAAEALAEVQFFDEVERLRAALVVQESRVARHYIGRIRFLEAELVRRPDRAGVMALLAHDVEMAIVGLPLAERRGAEVVLQVIRLFAQAPTVPTGDEPRPAFEMPEATA